MSRNLDPATIAELAKNDFRFATLVKIGFDTPIYITDWDRSVSALSQTWLSSSSFISGASPSESSALQVNETSLTLSGVDQVYISAFLNNDYIDKSITFYKAVLDDSDTVIGSPIVVFDGLINGFEITDSDTRSEIEINCASHFKDFEKENGRRTNTNSQQMHFPDDKGFDFAAKIVTDIRWGRS